MSWQHSPHRLGALLVFSLRQSYLHQNQAEEGSAAITRSMAFPPLWCGNLLSAWPNKTQDRSLECFVKGPSSADPDFRIPSNPGHVLAHDVEVSMSS